MEYIVQHKVKGQTIDVCVPSLFFVCVWQSGVYGVYVKAEFVHNSKQNFAVIFKGKKVIWSAATLVSYYRMSIPNHLLPDPLMPEEKCLVM